MLITRNFCDICGREIKKGEKINVLIGGENSDEIDADQFVMEEVCDECYGKVIKHIENIKSKHGKLKVL